MKIDPYYRRQKCSPMIGNDSSFRKYKAYVDSRWGSSMWGRQNESGVVDDGNFWQNYGLRVQSDVVSCQLLSVYVVVFPAMLVIAVSVSCGTAVIILVTAVICVICVTR